MSYSIDRVEFHWGKMPVRLKFSYGEVDSYVFVIVRLFAGEREGVGEACVLPEDFPDAFLPKLVGADARRLDSLLPTDTTDAERVFCEGVSMALHDLVGHISGLPLHALLGGKKRSLVPLMPCIFPDDPAHAAEKAQHFCSQGYREYLKAKLVGDLDEDLARVKAIRSVVPQTLVLQGDANEGYKTLEEAKRAVETLGEAGLDVFEDPLLGGIEDYRKLKSVCKGGAKIMVDALARQTNDLVGVLRSDAADVVGVHPDQPGSLTRALLHVKLARSFGVPVVVGGTGYSSVGAAAYQHLTAVALQDGPSGELGGFFDHGMPENLVKSTLEMTDGAVRIPDTPGTGVELDEDTLSKMEEGHKTWP